MKFWIQSTLLTVSLLILSGCTGATPAPPETAVIDSSLPNIVLTSHGKIVDMRAVAFEWKSINDPRVEGIYVYKKEPNTEGTSKLKYLTTLKSRFKTHFLDTDVQPDTRYSYAFKTYSNKAEGKRSKEVTVNTFPVLQSVSWIDKITGLPRVAKIIWRPHSSERVKSYIIERKTLEDKEWKKIATLKGRLNAEYIDTNLDDNHVYMYRVRVATYDGIISTPSKIVKVVTKALPISIANLKATTTLPKMIKLTWDSSKEKDFALYYLYRSDKIDGKYTLIAKLHNNRFTDKIEEDGKAFFYRVSAVDNDGLESIHDKNSIEGMTLGAPAAPALVEAQLLENTIELKWSKTDPRSVSYVVVKKYKKGWFDEKVEEFTDIKSGHFIDKNIEPNSTYTYTVFALDKNAIKSQASSSAVIVTPESTKTVTPPKQKAKKEVSTSKVTQDKHVDVLEPSQDLDLSGL